MNRSPAVILAVVLIAFVVMGQSSLSLHTDGIEFPDGSIQTSASLGLAEAARAGINENCSAVGDDSIAICTAYTVPTGKILVLESISIRISKLPDNEVRALLCDWYSDACGFYHFVTYQQTGSGTTHGLYHATEAFRMYFPAGHKVRIQLLRDTTTSNMSVDFSFSGYLVDANP